MRTIAIEEGAVTAPVIAGLEDLGFSLWYLPRTGTREIRRLIEEFRPDVVVLPLEPRTMEAGEALPRVLPSVRLVASTAGNESEVRPPWADLTIPKDADPIFWLLSLLALQPRTDAASPALAEAGAGWRRTLLVAIERTHHAFRAIDDRLQRRSDAMLVELRSRLEVSFEQLLHLLMDRLEAEVPGMAGHSSRVADLAGRLAQVLGLDRRQTEVVRMSGLLHDLGMHLVLPPVSLRRRGPLHQGEWDVLRAHPVASAAVLAPLPQGAQIGRAIREHHERLDGSGYPLSKRGEEVSIEARVVTVADAFEAMTHPRPHREAMSADPAIEALRAEARNGRFDPEVCSALVSAAGARG